MSENKKENVVKEKKEEKKEETVTIHDFKSILIGMDLILGDDWTPNEQQWKRIRSKIDALIETAERPVVTRAVYSQPNLSVDSRSSVAETDLLRDFPAVPAVENVPMGEGAPIGPSALTPLQPDVRDGPAIKTPDIDSSRGYKSKFV